MSQCLDCTNTAPFHSLRCDTCARKEQEREFLRNTQHELNIAPSDRRHELVLDAVLLLLSREIEKI